jgi:Calx-beta domain-containing protein
MRPILRTPAMAGAVALAVFGLMPAAHAAQPRVVTVDDFASYEGSWSCTADPPFTCSIHPGQLQFQIHMTPSPRQAVTLGWRLEDITTTAGQDYTGPTSGTVTFPANGYVTYVYVPVVNDGVSEPDETARFRITSSSIPADISDTAIGTIKNGSQVPADCTVTQTAYNNMFMTCTGRPATQHWHLRAFCANIGGGDFWDGNIVTGNGTSAVNSCGGYAYYPYFIIDP